MMTIPVLRPGLDRPVSLARIDAVIAVHLGPARVKGNAQPAAFNRQLAMYLAKHVGRWSTTRIGKFYNGRDHSTVCHAIRKIEALRRTDPKVAQLLEMLTERVLESETDQAMKPQTKPSTGAQIFDGQPLEDELLDLLADKIVERVLSGDRLSVSKVPTDGQMGVAVQSDQKSRSEDSEMIVTLELPPNVEAHAVAEAQARGVSVETVLKEAIADRFEDSAESADYSPEQRAQALREWARSHRPSPALSDAAISRESLYGER